MGGCVSISSGSSKGDETSPSPAGLCIDIFGCRWRRKASSDHGMNLQRLSWAAPNRILSNGRTSNSCIFTQQGRKGINQDAMIVWEDFMAEGVTLCGVFDGHGPHGHLVARKVRDALPLKLSSFVTSSESRRNGSGLNCCDVDARSDVVDPTKEDSSVESLWREAFLNSYKAMDKELKSHRNLDCFCSGTTAVTLVKQGSNIFMGNIGDSRAVLGSKDSNDSMLATQLTVDLKPDLPREADRIKRCKGRVFALQDEPEVPRVWLPFDDAPGLAMARAFGDFCLKEYGVISIPEFSLHKLTAQDKFIVLASDGVWDVLSNEEVVEIVWSAPARSSAARVVVESAAREWRSKYPTSKMDDCAVVCFFLDGKMDGVETDHQSISFSSAAESEPCLTRNYTVRSLSEDQSWSGLQGVSRVNSLVQLPRFSGP